MLAKMSGTSTLKFNHGVTSPAIPKTGIESSKAWNTTSSTLDGETLRNDFMVKKKIDVHPVSSGTSAISFPSTSSANTETSQIHLETSSPAQSFRTNSSKSTVSETSLINHEQHSLPTFNRNSTNNSVNDLINKKAYSIQNSSKSCSTPGKLQFL